MSDNYDKYSMTVRAMPPRSNFDLKLDGLSLDVVGESTRIISSHHAFEGVPSKPIVPPIVHSSTYILEKPSDLMKSLKEGGYSYSRLGNETVDNVDAAINILEKGAGSMTFASGMAAASSVLTAFIAKGDHVIHQVPSYPGTVAVLRHMVNFWGVEVTTVKNAVYDEVVKAIKPNTKMIWLESPCNPELIVVDIQQMAQLARSKNILLTVDGTFASPYAQRAIELGADLSVHSCTKYLGGHSDLLAGCVTTRTVEQWRILKDIQIIYGCMLSPRDASLLHRSIKTLPIRMKQISDNAMKVAKFLEGHPKVSRVHYPGLESHPQHQTASKQMSVYSGMIMADIKGGGEGGQTVAENIKLIKMAVSLGGVESILEHPYSMTHGPYLLTDKEREESCVTPGMLRISIGLEDPEDLIRDLEQALDKVNV